MRDGTSPSSPRSTQAVNSGAAQGTGVIGRRSDRKTGRCYSRCVRAGWYEDGWRDLLVTYEDDLEDVEQAITLLEEGVEAEEEGCRRGK